MRKLPLAVDSGKNDDQLAVRRCQVESFFIMQRLQKAVQERTATHFKDLNLKDITPSQANVLMVIIQRRRPMSARDIHRELGVTEVTISRLVSTLVANDWITKVRNPKDGRAALLSPTAKARQHLPDFIKVANLLLDETFLGLSRQELKTLHDIIQRVDGNLVSATANEEKHKT